MRSFIVQHLTMNVSVSLSEAGIRCPPEWVHQWVEESVAAALRELARSSLLLLNPRDLYERKRKLANV